MNNNLKTITFIFVSLFSAQSFASEICDRSKGVLTFLEEHTGRSCQDVKDEDLAKIKVIILSNPLTPIKPGDFDGLVNLEQLYLGNAKFESLNAGMFSSLSKLRLLTMSGIDLSTMPDDFFKGLENLMALELTSAQLNEIPMNVLRSFNQLQMLNLSFNHIATISLGAFDRSTNELSPPLAHLRRLELYKNKLTTLPEGAFAGLPELRYLSLSENLISLSKRMFVGLSQLTELNLIGMRLTSIPEDVFVGLAKLEYLMLKGNDFSNASIDSFNGLVPANVKSIHFGTPTKISDEVKAGIKANFGSKVRFDDCEIFD